MRISDADHSRERPSSSSLERARKDRDAVNRTAYFFFLVLMKTNMTTTRQHEESIECTPDSVYRGMAGCCGLLITSLMIASIGIIAGGTMYTAMALDRLTSEKNHIQLKMIA